MMYELHHSWQRPGQVRPVPHASAAAHQELQPEGAAQQQQALILRFARFVLRPCCLACTACASVRPGRRVDNRVRRSAWVWICSQVVLSGQAPGVGQAVTAAASTVLGGIHQIRGCVVTAPLHAQAPDVGQAVGKHSMHPEKYRQDLGRAIQLGFTGSCQQRRQLARTLVRSPPLRLHL